MDILTPYLSHCADTVLELLFPRTCVGCGKKGALLCDECRRKLPPLGPACPLCARPQAIETVCPACLGRAPNVDTIRSPYRFQDTIRQAIHAFKYGGLRALARPLAELLAAYLQAHPADCEVLVPVPLHPRRLRERGYNQSALLCRELGRMTGLPASEGSLSRTTVSPPQVRSDTVDMRRANVAGAFACMGHDMPGKRVLLVDDVCTSGATLQACAAALKNGGATYVMGLTIAKEV